MLLVAGEVEFHLMGFILVMTASALAGLRWTITQVLLQGSSTHSKWMSILLITGWLDSCYGSYLAQYVRQMTVPRLGVVFQFFGTKKTLDANERV